MLKGTLLAFAISTLLNVVCMVTVKEYTATTSSQYIRKLSSSYNGEFVWRITTSPSYTSSSYYLEVYWYTLIVQGEMPKCEPDYVEVFVKDTGTYRSIGKYCSSNTKGIRMKYMYSIGGEMLIKYRSTQNSYLYLRYRVRSRMYSYKGSYSSYTCYNTYSSSLTGDIYSSGYPRAYRTSSQSCYYKIVTSYRKETRIVMMDSNLHCSHYVMIKGSYSYLSTYSTSSNVGYFRCSTASIVVTRYRYIHIRFYRYSGSSLYNGGFLLSYIAYDVPTSTSTQPGACTFESDECGFAQSTTDGFNWLRHRGGTASYNTGPTIDHSTGLSSGYYLYIESSSPRALGHKAEISKQYSGIATQGSCLTFWYHLYGSTTGQLNVYLKNMTYNALRTPAWNLIGDQGDRWEMGQLTLSRSNPVVVFEGVIGSGYTGDLAIDDISLRSGPCSSLVPSIAVSFAIQHRYGKLCLSWNKLNDEVIFTTSCNELFIFTQTGALLHIPSGKCLAPIKAQNNGVVKLQSACNSANAWFYRTSLNVIRHMRTGKCIKGYLGSSTPTIGTKLIINSGCSGTTFQFNYINGVIQTTKIPSTTTNAPSTTTKRPSTTTKAPSTTTKAPSTTTKAPSTTTKVPSTTTKAPSTTTKAPSTTTKEPSTTTDSLSENTQMPSEKTSTSSSTQRKMNILDGNKGNQSANENEKLLTISVIVIAAIVCLMLIILATCFVSKWKKSRPVQRDSVLDNSHQNDGKAVNVYMTDPTAKPGAFLTQGGKRPLPEIPPNPTNPQRPIKAAIDIKTELQKQSIAVPGSFSSPVLTQINSDECEKSVCSLPNLSLRSNCSAGALSIKNEYYDERAGDVSFDNSNDFIAMKPIKSCTKQEEEEMYLDLDEAKDNVEEYRSNNIYEPVMSRTNDKSRSQPHSSSPSEMPITGISSQRKHGASSKSQYLAAPHNSLAEPHSSHSKDFTLPSRMEDLECKLSEILDFIERPVISNKRNSMPNVPKFNGAIPRDARKGSCPAVRQPFVIANQTAMEHVKEEMKQDEREEEENYLAPSDIHPALSQLGRKISKSYPANDSIRTISTLPEERVLKRQTEDELEEPYIKMTNQKIILNDQGNMSVDMADEEMGGDRDEAETVYQVMKA